MKYDLVVIGAGIQGAGVAQAAAAAGYSVLVLEQYGPAAGTSSKSSKLIHGGLRYLESFQFGLVRESLYERSLLLKLAPELVQLKPMHIPVYKHNKRGSLTIRAGLSLYTLLSGLDANGFFSQVPRKEWGGFEHLSQDSLCSIFRYYEAQTDDAALTCSVLYSALDLGADLEIPGRFVRAQVNSQSCLVEFESDGGYKTASCRAIVNCSGPWVSQVIEHISPPMYAPEVEMVQGSHLLLPPILNHHYYLEAPQDKRAVFVLPWKKRLMIGTTEKVFSDLPEKVACTQEEQEYLLSVLRHYFPNLPIDEDQVQSFAGLRVLPKSNAQAFSRPREVLFEVDNEACPRVLSVMGGKLTTYRATAEHVLAKLKSVLPAKKPRANTKEIYLAPVDWSF